MSFSLSSSKVLPDRHARCLLQRAARGLVDPADDVPEAIDLADETGRDHGGRVVLADHSRSLDPVARLQRLARVEARVELAQLAVDLEPGLALTSQRLRRH